VPRTGDGEVRGGVGARVSAAKVSWRSSHEEGAVLRLYRQLLIGRSYRKAFSQVFAFGAFRWVAVWLLVGECAANGQPVGTTGAIVIIAVDIISHSGWSGSNIADRVRERRRWADMLTLQTFYSLFLQQVKESGVSRTDVDDLFKKANEAAITEIERADKDSRTQNGWLDSTAWHWFGGVLYFLGQAVVYFLYYGSAFWVFQK